jgi:hypothetical protein
MRPLGKLTVESDRLRGRIEAIERLAAESRMAAEAQRVDEHVSRRSWRSSTRCRRRWTSLPERTPLLSAFFGELPRMLEVERMLVLRYDRPQQEFEVVFEARSQPAADAEGKATSAREYPGGSVWRRRW